MSRIFVPVLKLLLDSTAAVRKSMLSYVKLLLSLPSILDTAYTPHMDTLVIYIHTALTHVESAVRLDGVRMLHQVLVEFPRQMQPRCEKLLHAVTQMLSTKSVAAGGL